MTDDPQPNLVRAFRLMLRPVVRLLLRGGVAWKDAAEALKTP